MVKCIFVFIQRALSWRMTRIYLYSHCYIYPQTKVYMIYDQLGKLILENKLPQNANTKIVYIDERTAIIIWRKYS